MWAIVYRMLEIGVMSQKSAKEGWRKRALEKMLEVTALVVRPVEAERTRLG